MNRKIAEMIRKYYAVIGVLFLLILVIIPALIKLPEPWLSILRNIGISLFITLTISYIVNVQIKETNKYDTEELITKYFPKLLKYDQVGLSDIVYENNLEVLGIDIIDTSDLFIIMNDGKNFFTNNSKKLSERFKKPNKKTTVVLLNYDSDSSNILNKRNKKIADDYYQQKIKDCISDFKTFYMKHDQSNILKIYLFDYTFNMSIVATDKLALIGLYRNASGKDLVPPQFIFANNGLTNEYTNIMSDIDKLVMSSKEFDFQNLG